MVRVGKDVKLGAKVNVRFMVRVKVRVLPCTPWLQPQLSLEPPPVTNTASQLTARLDCASAKAGL